MSESHSLHHLLTDVPSDLPEELTQALVQQGRLRIERIVSTGQASPAGYWYDQDEAEWVVLLQGEAQLLFDGDSQPRRLRPGDFVSIPAHCRHRVQWTTPDEPTRWSRMISSRTGPLSAPMAASWLQTPPVTPSSGSRTER